MVKVWSNDMYLSPMKMMLTITSDVGTQCVQWSPKPGSVHK